jgi:2',3'-cyclic-nucleotide 2'-phosphodiesterase / 3'-nucleotidase / 5'-nucleotidase
MKRQNSRNAKKILSTSIALSLMTLPFFSTQAGAEGTTNVTNTLSNIVQTTNVSNVLSTNPFELSIPKLDYSSGVKATVTVKPLAAHNGNETVIFQLMDGTTPKGIMAIEKDITSTETVTAHFNVTGKSYSVQVFVVDKYNGSLTDVGTSLATPVSTSTVVKLRLMETTDIHTNLVDYDYYKNAAAPKVGLAKTATVVKQARSEVKNSLLVDNGDLIQGTPLGTYKAKIDPLEDGEVHPVFKAMNQMGYDIAGLGNHEFNYGLDFLDEAYDDANFPFVNANVYVDDKDSNPDNDVNKFSPYKIIEKKVTDEFGNQQTIKIGFIGFVPPQVNEWDKAHLDGKVITKGIVETAQKFVPEMREQGADVVVALTHSGFSGNESNSEDVIYALSRVAGIDAITFSHTHKVFPAASTSALDILFKDANGNVLPGVDNTKGTINGVAAVQAGYGGGHLGLIDLDIQLVNGQWKVANSQSSVRSVETATPDQAIINAVKPDHDATIQYVNTPIGTTTDDIHSYFALVQDDPSVQVVTNAQKWFVEKYVTEKKPEYANLPILSVGAPFKAGRNGVGEYTEIQKGDLTIRSAGDLYLYDNTLKAIKVKGSVVKEWIEMTAGKFNTIDPTKTDEQVLLNPSFPVYNFDVIDGVEYQIDVTKLPKYDKDGKVINADSSRVINLTYNGSPVDPNQDFIVVTNNYRAGGGGNFPGVKGSELVVDSADENRQILMDYIAEVGTINPTADNNWSIAPIDADVNVTFISSPNGEKYIKQGGPISYTNKNDTNGFGIFNLDLSPVKVQLLGINDFHGQLNVEKKVGTAMAGKAEYLAAYLRQREATNPNTLLVQAGDMVGASAPESALLQDEPTIKVLNSLGFDVGTVGNHEFDEGVDEMMRLIYGGPHPKTGNVPFEGSTMKYVVANLHDKATGELLFDPYVVKEIGGEKVGFIGVVLDETPSVVIPSAVADVTFSDEVTAINKYAAELKAQGVEAIVVLAHNPGSSTATGGNPTGEIPDFANRVNDEIDVIFGAHNHALMNTTVDGKLLVQAYSSGTAFADVDLEISPFTHDIVKKSAEVVTTFQTGMTPDPEVRAIVQEAVTATAPILNEVIGHTATEILKLEDVNGESAMGNLIADSMRWKMGSDFAAMNSGGVRNDLNAGDITWGELFTIQPFGNDLVKLTLTGAQVRQLLNDQFPTDPTAPGARTKFVYISGFKYTWDSTEPKGSKIKDIILPNGDLINETATYTITVNNFMADGGDGYTGLRSALSREVGPTDLQGLVDYVKHLVNITAAYEGRSRKLQ